MTATMHPEFNDSTEALGVAKALADRASQSPAHLILAGRTPAKIQESTEALKADYPNVDYRPLIVDLSKQKSVRAAAAELLSWADVPTLDIVVNSAGVMNIPARTIAEDGIEMHFATNHIGHFPAHLPGSPVFASMRRKRQELRDEEPGTCPRRNSPTAGWGGGGRDRRGGQGRTCRSRPTNQSTGRQRACSASARTGRLYAKHGILSLGLHPGVIRTELARDTPPKTMEAVERNERGGRVPESRDGGKENRGVFLWDCQISNLARPGSVSSAEAEKLWRLSEELVEEEFSW
ncbi:putative short-chain dehydrogenase [Hypoxylon sp. FL1150]|nr:putative short-chain dehydrogenase [Hypoxylon sp. FL1150]